MTLFLCFSPFSKGKKVKKMFIFGNFLFVEVFFEKNTTQVNIHSRLVFGLW
jgi:hypothetical protein